MCRWMPLLTPLAGLNTRYGISRPASRDGMLPLIPSGSTTGFGSGVLPSQRSLRYSSAPTCIGQLMLTDRLLNSLTSYHLGPSAHILINFSLNSSVCLSASLRSNLDASMVRSDCRDMLDTVKIQQRKKVNRLRTQQQTAEVSSTRRRHVVCTCSYSGGGVATNLTLVHGRLTGCEEAEDAAVGI